jgi:hypothetical protein
MEKMPCQSMLTATSNIRMNDEKQHLEAMVVPSRLTDANWTGPFGNSKSFAPSTSFQPTWQTHLLCAITVPHGLTPSFWTSTASQQYSLIINITSSKITIGGGKPKLEVPLQICYDLGAKRRPCGPRCRRMRDVASAQPCWDRSEEEHNDSIFGGRATPPPAYG